MLYPLKFSPILKEKIWGGRKLGEIYNRKDAENIGESWVLSAFTGSESVVANGALKGQPLSSLIDTYKDALVGKDIYQKFGNNFPLLFKLIDADDKLSIQVHPNDATAWERHKSFGKTEMWYIIEAEDGSELTLGFNKNTTPEEYADALAKGTLETLLHTVKVQAGDAFFINTGLVHAIGKGILLAEIQQSSDITYRIYDYQRKDANGHERQLHNQQALDVINYRQSEHTKIIYQKIKNEFVPLVNCKYFKTSFMEFSNRQFLDYSETDNFAVLLCVGGQFELKTVNATLTVAKGEAVMLPADTQIVQLLPEQSSKILETII
ncbi:MAG: class I mannose-6-phosphate isomerase [Prevotellaceae bacterium]|jgi:mannose-6-phosphate isomerase|nr:class I mannose-6-phosphate isomerase [Prevotellaceae bacterium]